MKAADIRKDPWKAKNKLVNNLSECVDILEEMWISEDGWEEEKIYRTKITSKLLSLDKLIAKTKNNINSLLNNRDNT